MTKSRTYIATPPGATIKEQLRERRMSQGELALRMGYSQKHISQLINGDVHLTPEMANRLEMVLGVPAQFWSNLESIYREKILLAQAENDMEQDKRIAKRYPYSEMAKNGWVPSTRRPEDRVIALRKFFEVANLELLKEELIPQIACRRQGVTEKADYALIAWAQEARREARDIPTSKINIEKLEERLPAIRSMTTMPPSEFCQTLINTMAECGVALVFLPHIGGSFLHGASFIDGSKVVMGLTVRGKDADRFWFSLFHEIGHVVLGHIGNPNGTTSQDETAADAFAQEELIPPGVFSKFIETKSYETKRSILGFANDIGIDAGIVVGRLQKEGYLDYRQFNDLKTKYSLTA